MFMRMKPAGSTMSMPESDLTPVRNYSGLTPDNGT